MILDIENVYIYIKIYCKNQNNIYINKLKILKIYAIKIGI